MGGVRRATGLQAARLQDYTDHLSNALSIDEIDRASVDRSDHVVVEVKGAGECQTDTHVIEGVWADYVDQDLPMTLGHEDAGKVEMGDTVICHPVMTCGECRQCRLGEDMHCENVSFLGLTTDGGPRSTSSPANGP